MSALSKYTLNRDYIDMSKFDEIAELSIDNYGIVTDAEVVKLGEQICRSDSKGLN